MPINILDDQWKILPTKSKGHLIPIAWLHDSQMPDEDWQLVIEVYLYYVRTKAASTASGVVTNTKPHVANGIPSLENIKLKWSGLKTNQKKGLNQFFNTLVALGYKRFREYHAFTTAHLDKDTKNYLDPSKGALTDFEFDSLAKQINTRVNSIDWSETGDLSFYRSQKFTEIRSIISTKLMLATVRRGIQLSILKWSDLIPTGASFNDKKIKPMDEIGTIGATTLQLRMFHAKETDAPNPRSHPERYPLYLSEDLSQALVQYKKFCLRGISLLLENSGLHIDQETLLHIANDIPVFPDYTLFQLQLNSFETFKSLFTPISTLFHTTDIALTKPISNISVASDRLPDCAVTINRLRHTVLTRAAQQGVPAVQLARITGVTVPAARHYVDMDYASRLLIDKNYLGNEFLKRAFSGSITVIPEGEEIIVGHNFDEVGCASKKQTCKTCKTLLGRPLGCYGCPNFRPILEANHRAELQLAQQKLEANRAFLFNPLLANTIKKLERQIEWVQLTITICDEILAKQRAIDAE
ncbi:hypothetical protein [Azonexus sp.]|uniref:hypothetical protein n=1 Tax=Azonexus sp. TaxID=1872668 RepID=UPI0035B04DF8